MKRILREPLVHFLLLGAALFIAYSLMGQPGSGGAPRKIVITQGQIDNLLTGFAKTWQRPPTTDEMAGLVRDLVREEIYCREAMAMGLEKDDTVIRRRLRQKLEFISDDVAALAEPTDADLNEYLQAHPDTFRIPELYTFSHVYLNPEKHGESLAHDAAELLAQLRQPSGNTDTSALGDAILLEAQFAMVPASEVAKQFGENFAAQLSELTPGHWQGPIKSGYGLHMVRVSERTDGHLPALEEVRDEVRREWTNSQRLEANDKFYQELLKRYTVRIEGLEPAAEPKKLAATIIK